MYAHLYHILRRIVLEVAVVRSAGSPLMNQLLAMLMCPSLKRREACCKVRKNEKKIG